MIQNPTLLRIHRKTNAPIYNVNKKQLEYIQLNVNAGNRKGFPTNQITPVAPVPLKRRYKSYEY